MAKYSQAKQFRFTGYVTFKKENLLKDKQGSTWRKVSFGITDEQGNNTQYVECSEFGAGNSFKVKTVTEDGKYEDIEVSWSERNDKKVIEDVANFNKKYVLGNVRLHNHDMIEDVLKAVDTGVLFPCSSVIQKEIFLHVEPCLSFNKFSFLNVTYPVKRNCFA